MSIIAHDLDYTVLWSDIEPKPARICADSNPYLKECYVGRENRIELIITGRPESERPETEDLLRSFGINGKLLMNPVENFEMEHIALIKAHYLYINNVMVYVEDNDFYRHVMGEYWNGKCISSEDWVGLI